MSDAAADAPIETLDSAALEAGLFGEAPCRPLDIGAGSLRAIEADAAGGRCIALLFDYARQHGSIGSAEADQIVATLRRARSDRLPFVLVLNSSGIRVTDSTAGIASLRRALREAADARLDGVRMLALVVQHAFGGASMLAGVCDRRVVHERCLYGMSGPKLISQIAGVDVFDSRDATAVRALLGGASRAAVSPAFHLVGGTVADYRRALDAWLGDTPEPPLDPSRLLEQQLLLTTRLDRLADDGERTREQATPHDGVQSVVDALLPGARVSRRWTAQLLAQRGADGGGGPLVLALRAPAGCGMRDTLALSGALLDAAFGADAAPRSAIVVDCESHAATPADERLVLSEAMAHLALVIRALHRAGRPVDVIVGGVAGGGIQAAIASTATSVSMAPGTRLRVLPKAALAALQKAEDVEAGSLAQAIAVGAVDRAFDARADR